MPPTPGRDPIPIHRQQSRPSKQARTIAVWRLRNALTGVGGKVDHLALVLRICFQVDASRLDGGGPVAGNRLIQQHGESERPSPT